MSIITLFTRTAPTLGGLEFDAVLEDRLETSVEYTQYPIESGANVTDHGIILPFRYQLAGIVSNSPLRPQLTDFTGALTEIIGQNSRILGSIAGLSAGLLAGSSDTRASESLQFLLALQLSRSPFDLDAGDIQLSNMVITDITRDRNPSNEQSLEFVAQLQELPTLNTLLGQSTAPPENDPAQTQIAQIIDRGEQAVRDAGAAVNSAVDSVLEVFQ